MAERAPPRPIDDLMRWGTGGLVALLLGLGALAALQRPPPSPLEPVKGHFGLLFLVQGEGEPEPREVQAPLRLKAADTLRLVLKSAEPLFVALYEERDDGIQRLWTSGEPLPAGQHRLGPEQGRAGLKPLAGRVSQFLVVGCEQEVGFPMQQAGPFDPRCSVERVAVDTR